MDQVPHELSGVARTLSITLRIRAEEHAREDGLFRDPQAVEWYARLMRFPDLEAWYSPVLQTGGAIRAATFDGWLRAALDHQPGSWVVELGAGLSTRYTRLGATAADWVEFDLPSVIAFRREFERERAGHWLLAGTLSETAWLDALTPPVPERLILVAEGVVSFIPFEQMQALVAALGRRLPGATLIFDVTGDRLSPAMRQNFIASQAPLHWLASGPAEIASLGLTLLRTAPVTDFHAERWRAVGIDPAAIDPRQTSLLVAAVVNAGC